jgi:hypothetical protein
MVLWCLRLVLAAASLEAWYRFSEVISDLQYDFSGNSNHCIVHGNPLTLGKHGLYFNGANDYADMPANSAAPANLDLTPPFTFTIWMYRKSVGDDYMAVVAMSNPTDLSFKFKTPNSGIRYPVVSLTTSAGSFAVSSLGMSVEWSKQ